MPPSDAVWVDWQEGREGVRFFVFGACVAGIWRFYERSTWDVVKHSVPATEERKKIASRLLRAVRGGGE